MSKQTEDEAPELPRRTVLMMGAIIWGLALLLAVGISYLSKLNIWLCVGIVVAAWVLNGVIAEIEDRSPGGFLDLRRKGERR